MHDEKRLRRLLFITSLLLLAALVGVFVLSYLIVRSSNRSYDNAKRFLRLVEADPMEVLHYLRETDPRGDLLKAALEITMEKDEKELEDIVNGINTNLMGDDEIEFFTTENRFGEKNATVLGYFAGCLDYIFYDVIPYPEDEDGEPYEGEYEVPYDEELQKISKRGS